MSKSRYQVLPVLAALCLNAQLKVTQNRYDSAATGANTGEKVLNVTNVNAGHFGKLYAYYVDGAVFAQPLYVGGVPVPKHGTHNVLFVATMNDKVYAFDADRAGPPLWMRDFADEKASVTPVPITDITNDNGLNLVGNVGIEGTPVIDPVENALYLVARTREIGRYIQKLHKLDLRDGKDNLPPVEIAASVASSAKDAVNGVLRFYPKAGNQRSALALVHGAVVIAWASHEDIHPYHGWILAYSTQELKPVGVFCTTPEGDEGGIWQSGRGPVVDAQGAVYFEVGNGTRNGKSDFGNSVIKLSLTEKGFAVDDHFTPENFAAFNENDADIGSTGPLLIAGTNTLLCGSKNGVIYVLDTSDLGQMRAADAGVLQRLVVKGGRILAGPAYWDGPDGPQLYLWSEADFLKSFRFQNRLLEGAPFARGSVASRGSPGGALSISSDGKQSGTGIVWATLTNGKSADHGNAPGVLRAFEAQRLTELWNSELMPKRDRLGTLVKFVPPLAVAGKVYIPNYDNAVNVYGLLH